MSLLIKALAAAEKDKQTELKKKQTAGSATDGSANLELAPIETQVADTVGNMEGMPEASDPETTSIAKNSELDLVADLLHDDGLSLAEEAGLTLPKEPVNKYVKPKAGLNKAASKAEDVSKVKSVSSGNSKSQPVSTSASSQKIAASAFVANQAVKNSSSKSALFLLGVAGALMIWLGLQGYQYIKDLTTPVAVIIKPAPQAAASAVANATVPATSHQVETIAVVANQDMAIVATEVPQKNKQEALKVTKALNSVKTALSDSDDAPVLEVAKKPVPKPLKNTGAATDGDIQNLPQNAAQHQPLKLISKTPAVGIDPALLSAYQAFGRGENAVAQQQYRDVLQRDVRNVDALLGMAAIAQRQGRDADAAGWYQKVLEIEPKNTIAQSAITSVQAGGEIADSDLVAKESYLKNMLAQQPDAANLHAALGNLFAAQNQWPAAQEAYFNASRFAPNNADYAFNLAISLDQLGKARLALAQYQRALDLLDSSGTSSPDRAQLEARIKALQTLK